MNYRAKNIGIAVALAALAAILTSAYVVNYKRHVQRGYPRRAAQLEVFVTNVPRVRDGADCPGG